MVQAKEKCNLLIKKYYRDKGIVFRDEALENEILASISPDSKMLDAGCGYDATLISKYCTRINETVGVDLVKEFHTNSEVETLTANLESLPFKDNYFDVIISRDVCKHLTNPLRVFNELKRVVKPGRKIIMVTPNKYDYASIISTLLPTSFKKFYLKSIFRENAYDNFPTFYRCNTKRSIRKVARETGLTLEKFISIRHYPYYLMFSVILFRIGILYDRLISALGLNWLQSSFLFVLVKKEEQRMKK